MQKRIKAKTRGERFIEHVVWNAAAGAALAVMILVLLGCLKWLDQVAPRPSSEPTAVVAVNRPSG